MCRGPELILMTRPWLGTLSHIHPALSRWWALSFHLGRDFDNWTDKKRDGQCCQVIKLEVTI